MSDWTRGPAKWAAVGVLGSASLLGIGWSVCRQGTPGQSRRALPEASEAIRAIHAAAEPSPGTTQDRALEAALKPASRTVNLNTASAAELEVLPGIGPAMARRILEYRSRYGRFSSIDQLDQVKGIGPKTLEKLRPLVRVE
jgi:competence protein ComEA